MTILYAGILLGALGVIFGGVLSFASKKFHVEVDERVAQVRECLGGANCGACGYPGCDGFAAAVVAGEAPINGCAPAGEKGVKGIAKIMGLEAASSEKMVCRVLCQGESGVAKERYQYDGYQSCATAAGLAGGPKDCRFACLGLGDCMDKCAFGAIRMEQNLCVIEVKKHHARSFDNRSPNNQSKDIEVLEAMTAPEGAFRYRSGLLLILKPRKIEMLSFPERTWHSFAPPPQS